MKFLVLTAVLFSIQAVASIDINSDLKTILNPPRADEVFVPPGFDDLDDAEITFVNHSTSSCFIKTYPMAPRIDHEAKTIRISNMSLILAGDFCISRDVASPSTLKLGELKEGHYRLEFETEPGQFTKYTDINVSKSKSEQKDDFEYAGLDVNGLTVKVNKETKNIELNLPGTFSNGCYGFKEIKVIDDRSDTVIEVLPIVEMKTQVCTQEIQYFNKEVKIPYDTKRSSKKLIHIRSADGVAINRIVNLE